MSNETFPIRSRRFDRAKRAQTIQHILGAFLLITAAVTHLSDEKSHHVVLPVLEMLAGATLIVTAIVDRFRKTHARVGWVEIAGALMTGVEAVAKLQERHHLSFHILTFIPPAILLLFGLFEERMRKRPYLGATDDAFEMRLGMRWTRRVPWEKLRAYRITPKHLELHRTDDKVTRLKLADLHDPEPAIAWATGQFEKRGLVSK